MKLATIIHDGATAVVRIDGDTAIVVPGHRDVGALLASDALAAASTATGEALSTTELEYAPLIPAPSKILCVGLNYRAHILEMKRDLPEYPVLFAKFPDTLVGAGHPVPLPSESTKIDWEGELAVIVARTVRRATPEQAEAAIAGYSIANDISMRDWQFRTREWLQGKIWEKSTPLGPVLATPDEIPAEAYITTTVDGVQKQRGDIHDLVHDPVFLVSYISTITTLNPGDVIITGTPGGVGHAREPEEYLQGGSVVSVTIDGIGTLTNTLVAEESA